MNYEIRFRDFDPDTGNISQDKLIAVCETKEKAQWVLQALDWADQGEDPNREMYIKEIKL